MAMGSNDFLWCSVVHRGGMSLSLNVFPYLTSKSWRGWEELSNIVLILDIVFPFLWQCCQKLQHPSHNMSCFADYRIESAGVLHPSYTTPAHDSMSLATTDLQNIHSLFLQMLKDPSPLYFSRRRKETRHMSYKEEEAVAEEQDNNLTAAYTVNASSRSDSRLYVINSLLTVYTSPLQQGFHLTSHLNHN